MSSPFGKRILFSVLGISFATGGAAIAASPDDIKDFSISPDSSQVTEVQEPQVLQSDLKNSEKDSVAVIETTLPSTSSPSQPKLLADADTPTVSELMGGEMEDSSQGDPSLHNFKGNSQGQVTSVSQLSDVRPTDWAFQALQSLVERYGCIAGYPNGTFRGNRSATRYEMAAALNACLDQISDRFASKADLDAVKALQDEFAAELATLRGRVDGLEARVSTVEAQQFSTTTKLKGEAIFGFSGLTGDVADGIDPDFGPDIDSRLSLTNRARLVFVTSFTGKDRLFTRLQAQNRPFNFSGASGTATTRLSFDTGDSGNTFALDRLDYKFPIGDVDITIFTNAAFHHYYATTVNYFEGFGGGKGSISWFGERNPIYRNGTVGVSSKGIGTSWIPGDGPFRLDVGYFANAAQSSVAIDVGNGSTDGGLFGGGYSALAQASYTFGKKNQVGLTYVRTFDPSGLVRSGAGTALAQSPFGNANSLITNSVGVEGSFGLGDKFVAGGWFGYTFAEQASGANNDAQILNAALTFAALDVLKEGATAGLIVGIPPYVINSDVARDPNAPIHIEANYQFPVNDNIKITPGIIYLINPGGNSVDGDIFVGVIRTTFTF